VRDPRPPQGQQLPVQLIQQGVADLSWVGVGQRGPGGQPESQERVAGWPGGAGLEDLRHGHARPGGPQGEVGLVLDLLQPGDGQLRPGIAVQHEPARLGQQPRIGRIPAVDLDADTAR
jgi:hypothetical protein